MNILERYSWAQRSFFGSSMSERASGLSGLSGGGDGGGGGVGFRRRRVQR